ncbi:MAG: histidinol-phosphate transaminase [Bacteroidales bacterium]|nr:histidinol-phosphate transaminase [Bacteroidales bacterium]MDD3430800.1 histidinol-phosphate transaminase [Bacteroidales bacterium]MDD4361388.1 histidinol-phosphate transaminase [Bacteroidales bacterium]MDD4430710.1 histidinol-phosphate transaminase [Bacteroidales bacterium]
MSTLPLEQLLRKNIKELTPYSCARDEFQGQASVYLDANENPYNAPYNRYPDPLQRELKLKIAAIKGLRPGQVFLGNGSDESIDVLFRAFCEPRTDNVVAIEPTYGMYRVAAGINDVAYRTVLLDEQFQMDADKLLAACDERTKLIFLCSPNNPTGNSLNRAEVLKLLNNFEGLLVLDEAYIDFASEPSLMNRLDEYPGLVVLQTFSKAWGSAAIRLGMALASESIVKVLNKIKYPYNIGLPTQQQAMKMLEVAPKVKDWVASILQERDRLSKALSELRLVKHIYPTDANFLLVRVSDANRLYTALTEQGIIVRNRNNVSLCLGCLRITVGTSDENNSLLQALKAMD